MVKKSQKTLPFLYRLQAIFSVKLAGATGGIQKGFNCGRSEQKKRCLPITSRLLVGSAGQVCRLNPEIGRKATDDIAKLANLLRAHVFESGEFLERDLGHGASHAISHAVNGCRLVLGFAYRHLHLKQPLIDAFLFCHDTNILQFESKTSIQKWRAAGRSGVTE